MRNGKNVINREEIKGRIIGKKCGEVDDEVDAEVGDLGRLITR